MQNIYFKEKCKNLRREITALAFEVDEWRIGPMFYYKEPIPDDLDINEIKRHLELALNHLEGAEMRIEKALNSFKSSEVANK